MKSKKGFTIVELVIVIAVIAILAAVLIPTFSNVISKANESACLQSAKSKFNELYAIDYSDGYLDAKESGTALTDGNGNVLLDGYDTCKYSISDEGGTFSYHNDSYKSTLTITATGNTWTFDKWETTPK